ncbi:hypothetical protein BVY02_02010 [bacterium J17]|nr:hypothetical protein BVY02_02010 [bacterium J17]
MAVKSSTDSGHRALIKVLTTLGLISEADANFSRYPSKEHSPIAYFALQGCFKENEAIDKVSQALAIKKFEPDRSEINTLTDLLEAESFSEIPLSFWQKIKAIPVAIHKDRILVAVANPLDHESTKNLEFTLGKQVEIQIAREQLIKNVIGKKLSSNETFDIESIVSESDTKIDAEALDSISQQESSIVEDDLTAAPIVRLANKIFSDAVRHGASDIHITPEKEKLNIRIRVDGIMRPLLTIPKTLERLIISRIKLLGGLDISEKRRPQDGRIRIKTTEGTKDLRISTVPTAFGENMVIRVLSSDISLLSFKSLGMPEEISSRLLEALSGSSRIVLVTGPTGSGKTSTLYASLLEVRNGENNIITVEDPIEYRIQGISQIPVNKKIGMTFAEGLRSILRQDPDVVMVGEIRDAETGSVAMQATQTGHLVLSTLHTNSAAAAITRLADLNIPYYLIASSLGTILAQRLVRTLCENCKRNLNDKEKQELAVLQLNLDNSLTADGCSRCDNIGYSGRIGVYSLLEVDEHVRNAIREQSTERVIEDAARALGFLTLEESAIRLTESGQTSLAEVKRVIGSLTPEKTRSFIRTAQAKTDSSSSADLKKRTILFVEDDPDLRTVFTALLEKEMFEVIETCNGQTALQALYEHHADLILCDLMMPKMSGAELLQKIRSHPATRDIPMLFLTANDAPETELHLIKSGADDFISKSARPELIIARINNLLNRVG